MFLDVCMRFIILLKLKELKVSFFFVVFIIIIEFNIRKIVDKNDILSYSIRSIQCIA